ncbi:MAG: helix-turn-helix domain-containing protein [Pseudoalteromonas sp.]|uniref:helix-turn-helix domain-containing protein n=1 Tax=unclassified Pseudoalteromonas TaxID=194690 RepID=UPI003F9702B3
MIVKKLRVKNKWSQEQLATMSGLSARTIQRVESGQSASFETLKSLASVFEIDINKLTEEITMIDKTTENWKAQPWWFRFGFLGMSSRKAQLCSEFAFIVLGLAAFVYWDDKFAGTCLVICGYYTSWLIRYGDKQDVW